MEKVTQSIKLNPSPGYVIKTRIVGRESEKYSVGTKVFVNICYDNQVPKPEQEFDPSVVFALIVDNKWEIPIIVSKEKEVKDKLGSASLAYDCCINDTCFRWCNINGDLRSILNEWCIEAIELLYGLVLDRQYSIPKMLCKGELSQTEIKQNELHESGFQKQLHDLKQNEVLGLVNELDSPQDQSEPEGAIDVFNINKQPNDKKPLIQEIDTPISKPISTTSPVSSKPQQIMYNVNFKKLEGKHSFMVKFETDKNLDLDLQLDNLDLIITSNTPNTIFSSNNQVKIPLPHNLKFTPELLTSFQVPNESCIYIFF